MTETTETTQISFSQVIFKGILNPGPGIYLRLDENRSDKEFFFTLSCEAESPEQARERVIEFRDYLIEMLQELQP